MLRAGEATIEITPPNGVELAGFHKPLGQERRVEGAREPAYVRALVLEAGGERAGMLSLEMCCVSQAFARRVKQRGAELTGIPPEHILVCATHTHSMPAFAFLRQWGAIPEAYMQETVEKCVEALALAVKDLAEADLYLGKQRVTGGNFNRTVPQWKTDEAWDASASDSDRWLDTQLHALYFQREQRPLLWYHFSAHPVCYGDALSGPDWPGIVARRIGQADGVRPTYLQGHIGDVNPGDGTPWVGDAEETAAAVAPALHHAMGHAAPVPVDQIKVLTSMAEVPLDLDRLQQELAHYEAHPEQCTSGVWVDAPFAKAWYEDLRHWEMAQRVYQTPIAALSLGPVALLFHGVELYSFYGVQLRKQSPFADTLVVGYCDHFLGYLTDPQAYAREEYAAIVVPKITGIPPFAPDAGRRFTEQCAALLRDLADA